MGEESSHRTVTTPPVFTPTQPKLPAPKGAPKEREANTYVHFKQQTPSQDNLFNTVNPFRINVTLPQQPLHSVLKKTAILDIPLPSAETCDEQSHPKTNTVTAADVHKPGTSRTSHTPPSMPSSPEITIDMTDDPHPSSTLILTEGITGESTDT